MFTIRISLNLFNHVIKNTANQKLEICSLHLFYFFSVVFLFSVYSCLGCDGKVCLFKITIFFSLSCFLRYGVKKMLVPHTQGKVK